MLHRRISRTTCHKQGKTRLGFCNSLLNSFTGISGETFSGAFSIETSGNFTPALRTSFFNIISSKTLDLEIHTSCTEKLHCSFQKPFQICPSINRLSKKQLSFALIRAVVVRYLDANGLFVPVNTTIVQSAFRKTNSCSFRFCSLVRPLFRHPLLCHPCPFMTKACTRLIWFSLTINEFLLQPQNNPFHFR